MVDYLHRRKRTFLAGGMCICLLALVLSIFPGVRPELAERGLAAIVIPMQRGAQTSVLWVQSRFAAMADNTRLIAENTALTEENIRLLLQIEQLQLAGEENRDLTGLLEMRQRFPELLTTGARIIGTNPNNARARFTIEAGTRDGVAVHMPVLAGDAVLGIIRYAGLGHSEVVTVFDNDFSVAVHSARGSVNGIVRGDAQLAREGLVRMDYIAATANIVPGDTLVTSAYSQHFPPGLPVGTVVSLHNNPDGMTRHAYVEPAAGAARPLMVLVVRGIVTAETTPHLD